MKYKVDNLMFELTRFCNMSCPHCIRGEAERKRIKKDTISAVLDQIGDYIPSLAVTGGEPGLAVDLIEFLLEECKRRNIGIGSFWLATNGSVHSKRFFDVITRFFEYADDGDFNGLKVSIDKYHESVETGYFYNFQEELEYSGVKCYFEYEGAGKEKDLIYEGRAKMNYDCKREVKHDIDLINADDPEITTVEGVIYINVRGDIISTCDISYETQDEPDSEFNLGNIHRESLDAIFDRFFASHPERVYK